MGRKRKNNHYVNNEDFMKEIILYHETGKYSDELWIMFYDIAKNYATKSKFNRNYSLLDDMITNAVLRCLRYINSFNYKEQFNPFAYFTTVIHNSFLQTIAKEKIQEKKKWKELGRLIEDYVDENQIQIKIPHSIMEKINE